MSSPVPIALIDDHAMLRSALAEMINNLGGYRVVVEADHGRAFIEAVENGAHVELAIVDLHMPVMDGFATLAWMREHMPTTRALALTFERTEHAMLRALRAGACGFLLKDVDREEFRCALEHVVRAGHYHMDSTEHPLTTVDPATAYARQRKHILGRLTERDLEFLTWVCDPEEFTYEVIAEKMGVALRTVQGYRESLFEKFGIKSKCGLAIFAMKWRLLGDPV